MAWGLSALAASLFLATLLEINRHYKMDGLRLNFWRTLVSLLFFIPFLPYMYFPPSFWFYAVVAIIGIGSVVGLVVQFNMAAKHSGRVTAMSFPIKTGAAFLIWFAIKPALFKEFLADPVLMAGVIAAFVGLAIGIYLMRGCDVSRRNFMLVLPLGVMYAVTDILGKIIMTPYDMFQTILTFCFVSYVASTAFAAITLVAKSRKPCFACLKPDQGMVRAAFSTAIIALGAYVFIIMSLVLAPNPAYPSAILLLIPVWLMLYHKWFTDIPEDSNPKAALVMVAAAILLTFVTS